MLFESKLEYTNELLNNELAEYGKLVIQNLVHDLTGAFAK
jgi:hypothetical protein